MARDNVKTTVTVGMDVRLAKRNAEALKSIINSLNAELKTQRELLEKAPSPEAYQKISAVIDDLLLKIRTLKKVQSSATPATAYEAFISGDAMNSNTLRQANRGAKNRLNTVKYGTGDQEARQFINDIDTTQKQLNRLQAGFTSPFRTIRQELNNLSGGELQRLLTLLQQEQKLVQGNDKAWANYAEAIAKVEQRMREYDTLARQQVGAQTLAKSQIGGFSQANERDIQRTIEKLKEYRAVISDPSGAGRATWEATTQEIHKQQAALDALKQKAQEYEVIAKRRSGSTTLAQSQRGEFATANEADLQRVLEKLKEYRSLINDPGGAGRATWEATTREIIKQQAALDTLKQKAAEMKGEAMSVSEAFRLGFQGLHGKFKGDTNQLTQAKKVLEEQLSLTQRGTKEYKQLQKAIQGCEQEEKRMGMTAKEVQAVLDKPKGKSYNELKVAVEQGRMELARMRTETDADKKKFDELAAKVKECDIQMKQLAGSAKGTASAFDKAWSRLKTYIGLYMGAAVAIQKLTGTLSDLMELSDKMGEVRKTTGFTADEVGRLSGELKKLDTRTTITGLLDLSVAAGQLGLKTQEDVEGFTIAANKLMVALPEMGKEGATEMLKVALATGEIDKIRRQMEEGLIDGSSATAVAMEKVGSTIDRLRATSAATAPAITDFVKRVGAVGAQSGISIDQVAALGSTVDALGMRVEMSATALSRMIPAIKNNAFAIGQVIGKTEEYIKTQFRQGNGMSVVLDIFDAINKSGKKTADDIEAMFGGSMQEIMKELNQQGARAGIVFAGLSQNVDELRRQLGIASKAYEENIAIQQEYNKMNETTAAKWERMKNELEEMFVGDTAQRWLGYIIDGLRNLVNLISGNVKPALQWLSTTIKTVITMWAVFKLGLGEGLFYKLAASIKSLGQSIALIGMYTKDYLVYQWQLIRAKDEEARATVRATMAQKGLNKEMMANIWGAVATAIAMVVYKLYEYIKASKEAAAEAGRFSQKVYEEQQALNSLFEPLNKSNLAQEERSKLISEINSKYSKYLGYMLSEASTAAQLADAHALIAKRIREEAYERRIAEQEKKVQEEHDEDVNAAYAKMTDRLRGGARGNADAQAMADMLKGIVDNMMGQIKYAYDNSDNIFKTRTSYYIDPKVKAAIDNGIDRLVVDGKLSRDNVSLIQKAVYKYTVEAKSQHDEMMKTTANMRSDLRNIQGAIQNDLTRSLNGLVNNMINFAKQQSKPTPQQTPGPWAPQPHQQGGGALTPFWQQGDQRQTGGWGMGFESGGQQTEAIQRAPKDWKPDIDEKDVEQVRRFVKNQDDLRGAIAANAKNMSDDMKDIYESWKVSETELDRLRKLVADSDKKNNPGGGGNPYGNYTVMDSYDKWSADALVDRKKQMLQYVRAMANGADVQSILSQDKKFMDEATRKGIKNVRDAIEWYNTERLKIQEELAGRHLTNEGGWANPAKAKGRKKRQVYSEEAVAELDRYYAWRKEEIERQRTEEGISEAEYNRRIEVMEQEHLERRSKLRWTFTNNTTKAEKAEVEQFWKWWKSVKELDQDIDRELINAEWKVATAREKAYNNRDAQRDLTAMNAIIVKQMKVIEGIINKERPFNGITDNLEENLTKMGVLFADFDKKRKELLEKGESTEEIDKLYGTDRAKRLTFVLEQSENAFMLTIEELMKRMADAGMQAWADEIQANPMMQQALLAEMHSTYDQIQNAIKKEASQIKKEVDIWWNDLMPGQDTSRKGGFEKLLSQLGLAEDQVKRANSLIGAGATSERVADKLAIKQMQIRLSMQQTYYNRMRQIGEMRIQQLKDAAKIDRESGKLEEAKRKEQDAEHLTRSLNLSLSEEQKKLDEQRVAIANQLEESQNRLYTQLREWGDLLASSVKDLFEASHAGDAEYYNELAKMNLTGKGGPGAGTYIVIDNEGTEDARAHYEFLDERAALERQHEIEVQNAQAEAWKKVMDDLNAKMNEQITDWINARLQNQSIDANTTAVDANTLAVSGLAEQLSQGVKINTEGSVGTDNAGSEFAADKFANYPGAPAEQATSFVSTGDFATDRVTYYQQVSEAAQQAAQAEIDASNQVRDTIVSNTQQQRQVTADTNKKILTGTQSAFAKMTAAANLYGIAYQAMSNDNLSTTQKFEMIAVQAAGQAAISALTASLAQNTGQVAADTPAAASKAFAQLGPIGGAAAFAAITALLGGLLGIAVSKIAKSKSQIAQVTGASVSAGRLATGMLTYAEGNVNEFTDPSTLKEGRSYNVDGADGRTYRARYMGSNPRTHLTSGPEFHLSGERGREMIIDAGTTRQITMNDNEIWRTIQALSAGGRLPAARRRRGVRAFAGGNVEDFEEMRGMDQMGDSGMDLTSIQDSLDRNSAIQEALLERLNQPIVAQNILYGPDGLPNVLRKLQKEAERHGEKYT